MDNDVPGILNTLGFDTATDAAAYTIRTASWDTMTMARLAVVFTMGYDCPAVAIEATNKAVGLGAKVDCLHVVDSEATVNDVAEMFKREYVEGKPYIIVACEGVCERVHSNKEKKDEHIHKSYDTSAYMDELHNLTGHEFKMIKGDYSQRAGIPTDADRNLAFNMARLTSLLIKYDYSNLVIGGNKKGEACAENLVETAKKIRAGVTNGICVSEKVRKIKI